MLLEVGGWVQDLLVSLGYTKDMYSAVEAAKEDGWSMGNWNDWYEVK